MGGKKKQKKKTTRLCEGQWAYKKKPTVQIIYKEPLITSDQLHTVTDGPPQTRVPAHYLVHTELLFKHKGRNMKHCFLGCHLLKIFYLFLV